MIDLYALCADLKNRKSRFRQRAAAVTAEIYSFLRRPSPKTEDMIAGWSEDFRYIYGEAAFDLSGGGPEADRLFAAYGTDPPPGGRAGALRLLFFSIQTYFSLLLKYIMADMLLGADGTAGCPPREIILGGFAEARGIRHYCCADWYCWPLFELDNGFAALMEELRLDVAAYRLPDTAPEPPAAGRDDLIKQIYQGIIPRELRHALGEYYTPDWLAESVLESAAALSGGVDFGGASVIDPTCGSGTFLLRAIARKRGGGASLSDILSTVRGIDINPLAVLTAKTNYLLSVLDLLDGAGPVFLPVYTADVVRLSSPPEPGGEGDLLSAASPSRAVREQLARDGAAAAALEKSDIVIGNPPWVNWEYLPEQYRRGSRRLWADYGLFSARGRDLSFSKEDISVLITYIAVDRLLKESGVIGFVVRQGMFKSARNGAGFRKFSLGGTGIKVLRVEDLSKIRVFENAVTSSALFFAKKGEATVYPVPYRLWERKKGSKKRSFGAYAGLREVMEQIDVTEQWAVPAVSSDAASPWLTAGRGRLAELEKVLGTNPYRARTGVFTGGANAVYWLRISGARGDLVSVSNLVGRARRKSEQVTAELEKDFLFPMLKGSGIGRWRTEYDTYLLCPHTAETRMRPVPQRELARTAPKTMEYLLRFRDDLDGRSGFAGWEKEIQRQEFHAVLRVGGYTFSSYKVVWRYIASAFICAVAGPADDPYLGRKPVLPNEKVMYVSTEDEEEAYYLCGLLSSAPVAECVRSFMNPTSISAHVLDKLNIPAFDKNDPVHRQIAALCRQGHRDGDISPLLEEIDALAGRLYGIRG